MADKTKTFLILGGYGNAGRLIAELLLSETDLKIVLAGRSQEKANKYASMLNDKFPGSRVSAIKLDAANSASLTHAFRQVDFVVVASSTIDYVQNIATAAIEAKIDYLDTQLSTITKSNALQSLRNRMEQTGCCFITDGGFHPGVPGALVRYADSFFDQVDEAIVASLIKVNWAALSFSESTALEMVEEFKNYRPVAFQNGQWKPDGWKDYKTFDFGPLFGKKYCVPMMMEEMRELPEKITSLKQTGFFVVGFNWLTDYFIIPLMMTALKIAPTAAIKPSAKLFAWSLKKFSKPPFRTILLLEASGMKNKHTKKMRITLSHEDGYFLTAVPVVACLLQYLSQSHRKSGLWFQANFVEPNKFFEDIKRLGINFNIDFENRD